MRLVQFIRKSAPYCLVSTISNVPRARTCESESNYSYYYLQKLTSSSVKKILSSKLLFKSHPNHNPAHVYHFHQVPGAELGEGGSVVDLSHIAPSVLALIQVGTIITISSDTHIVGFIVTLNTLICILTTLISAHLVREGTMRWPQPPSISPPPHLRFRYREVIVLHIWAPEVIFASAVTASGSV